MAALGCVMFGAALGFGQTVPEIVRPYLLPAYDGFTTVTILTAHTAPGVPVTWRVQVGTRSFPVTVDTSLGGAVFISSTYHQTSALYGPMSLADNGQPVTVFATNRYGTTSLAVGTMMVTGRPPTFQPSPLPASTRLGVVGSDAVLSELPVGSLPLHFQWRKNGTNIPGATDQTLILRNLTLADDAVYYMVVTNPYGTAISTGVRLMVAVAPVTISQQPQPLAVALGATATFQVTTGGSPPFTFQWRKDGVAIAGATQNSLSIPAVQATHMGSYSVVATNAVHSVTSSAAALTLAMEGVAFATQPRATTAIAGSPATLQVSVTGTAPISFQWRKDGVPINGGTTASLDLPSVQPSDAGTYTVVATNAAGSLTSSPAPLTVTLPVSIAQQPADRQALLGSAVTFQVAATGTGPLTYQWRKDGAVLPGATGASLEVPAVAVADAGAYAVAVTNSAGTVSSSAATLDVTLPGRIVNFSVMTTVAAAGESFTIGVVIGGGTGSKPVLVRAVGPSLIPFGATGVLADPRMEFFNGNEKLGENDDWAGNAEVIAGNSRVGAFPFAAANSKDAALFLSSVVPGANSIRISGGGSTTGTVLAELYDATPTETTQLSTPRLANVSVLKPLGTGLTAGFVVAGTTPVTVLVRLIGPGLAIFGVTDFVADPRLELFADTTRLSDNDNWAGGAELAAAFGKVAAFALPPASRDAALLTTLPPGNYSVQATANPVSSGLALIEVYEVP